MCSLLDDQCHLCPAEVIGPGLLVASGSEVGKFTAIFLVMTVMTSVLLSAKVVANWSVSDIINGVSITNDKI